MFISCYISHKTYLMNQLINQLGPLSRGHLVENSGLQLITWHITTRIWGSCTVNDPKFGVYRYTQQ